MIMLPFAAFMLGFVIVYQLGPAIPSNLASYVALSILAGFDALPGLLAFADAHT